MFSLNLFGEGLNPRPFDSNYRCYSVSMFPSSDKQAVEDGGKIIMPPSALEQLTRLNVEYPMLFKLTNNRSKRVTHCGVLEFVADEGKIYIPYWMMRNLLLDEGDSVQVQSVSVPVATFSKFEPQNVEFLDITNPKAVLENALRNFACLTTDDVIAINYNDRIYEMRVLEVRPGNAVSIIECDMNVEFAAPVGYQEPERREAAGLGAAGVSASEEEEHEVLTAAAAAAAGSEGYLAFQGSGSRLDGKKKNLQTPLKELVQNVELKRGVPDYNYSAGSIKFWRRAPPPRSSTPSDKTDTDAAFDAFQGEGTSLRQAKNK
ncbi:Ubiquitin fusion degradation protein Ufd1-like [Trinorchestia longiramus]|nr:Ubiquitin fusion degradation protein Ufd1-like [Trinorchestia longiramus]